MKKFSILLSAALVMFALTGCQNDINEGINNENNTEGTTFVLSANIDSSRTTTDATTYEVEWEDGDVIYLATTDEEWGPAYNSGENKDTAYPKAFTYSAAEGIFTTDATISNGEHTFNAIYEAESQRSYHRGASTTHKLIANQTMDAENPTATLKENDALAGQFTLTTPTGSAGSVTMKHLYALMQVNIKNNTGADITITNFMMATPANLAGVFNVTFGETPSVSIKSGASDNINVAISNGTVADGETLPVYFLIAPLANHSGEVKFVVTDTDGNTYTKAITVSNLTFAAGTYNTTPYTITEADSVDANAIALPWMETFDGDLSAYDMTPNEKGENYIDASNAQLSTAPELMFRFGTSFTATIASDGTAKTLYLTFNANYTDRVSVTSTTEGVTVEENGSLSKLASYIVNVPAGLQSFTIVLNNIHTTSNVRIDNIRLAETEYERSLTSIAIAGATDTFAIGSTYEFDGVVNATYDSYETVAVEGYIVYSDVNTEKADTYEVTISYTEGGVTKTASYSVTVKDASSVQSYTLTIDIDDFPGSSYANNNGEHSKDGVSYNTNQMMKQGSQIQWQKSKAYIYNNTNLGKIESITLDNASGGPFTVYAGTTANPTETTITGSSNTFNFSAVGEYGFFTIKCGSSTGKCDSITINYTK